MIDLDPLPEYFFYGPNGQICPITKEEMGIYMNLPFVRFTAYKSATIDENTMSRRTVITESIVDLDIREIESFNRVSGSPGNYKLWTKSGREWSIGEDDYNKIMDLLSRIDPERAIR